MASFIPNITKLSPRIIRILGCNPSPMTLQGTNTYLIGSGNKRLLLDTGEKDNEKYLSNLLNTLKEHNVSISHVVLSHWHHDHTGGLFNLCEKISNPIVISKFPLEEHDSYGNLKIENLLDRQKILIDGATLNVFHTPGHTEDHVILQLEEENAVFSGDCILGEGTAVFEDLYSYMKSLNIILDLSPSTIYPGHGPVIDSPVEKIKYYLDHRNAREQQILKTLEENGSSLIEDIVLKIYTDTPKHLHLAAQNNVNHHLSKLLKENKVFQSGDKWGLVVNKSSL